jgi:hypothetical protein
MSTKLPKIDVKRQNISFSSAKMSRNVTQTIGKGELGPVLDLVSSRKIWAPEDTLEKKTQNS